MPKTTPKSPDRLMTPGLRARGWTDGLIRRFLPEPCATRPNFYSRSGPPIRLYDLARVEAVEASPEWQAAVAALAGRKAGAARGVESKRAALRAWVEALAVEVPKIPPDELVLIACDHYNARAQDRADRAGDYGYDHDWRPASRRSSPAFLARIAVNFLRHEGTDYEQDLGRLFGRVGKAEGYVLLKRKVLAAIARAYPHLAAECDRQAAEMEKEAALG